MFNFLFKKRELLPLPYTRELHCHIIPGVDDGSQHIDKSIQYLKSLQSFGVEKVIFTPHHTVPRFLNTPQNIEPLFNQLKQRMAEENLQIEAENYSFEYRVDEGFLQMLNAGKMGTPECQIRPLHGQYLLIESGWEHPIPNFEQIIERLLDEGYFLILAHPERYLYYAGHHGRFYDQLQAQQVQFQCNILSFAGYYGEVEKKMALWMLDHGYVNFLGSDLHHSRHCEQLDKYLRSKEYEAIYDQLYDCINNDSI